MSDTIQIDLGPFCGKEETRPYLHAPFSRGEYTYATSGFVLVRVPRRPDAPELPPQSADGKRNVSDAAEKRFAENPCTSWRPAPEITLPPPEPTTEECDHCNGRGTEHDCPDCDCDCPVCDRKGTVDFDGDEDCSVTFAFGILSRRLVRRLWALPSLEIGTATNPKTGPLPFRFAGGDGLVMPLSRAYADNITVEPHMPSPQQEDRRHG